MPRITLTIDPAFLESAVYPVYVDPSTTDFPSVPTTTANDTFASSKYPNSTFGGYQRPDSPYYSELWHGKDPDGPYYSQIYIRFNSIAETLGNAHIDSASLQMYPYHQYFGSDPKPTWVRRITSTWASNTLKWNLRPGTSADIGQFDTSEDVWTDMNVQGYVQDVVNGTVVNHGLMLHADTVGQGHWKRFISRNDTHSPDRLPKLVVTWHPLSATPAAPIGGAANGNTLTWTYNNGDPIVGTPQSHYHVQVSTASSFAVGTIVRETTDGGTGIWAAGTAPQWTFPTTGTVMVAGTTYWWRVRVKDGSAYSGSSSGASFVYVTDARRGEETFYTRAPFDLGGGWRMAVGAHNGELTLDRQLFEIPSYGPGQSLALNYSSLDTTAGYFGTGWSSNLSQSLSFATNTIYWNRPDGGVVSFVQVVGVWTPMAGHHEKLTYDAPTSRYILTLKDQARLFFENASPGRLLRVENRFGKALAVTWNSGSATASDASGRTTSMVISSGRITQVTDSAGRSWSFGYASNNLTSVTDPAGKVTTLAYGTGGLTSVTRTRSRVSGSPETITWSVAYTGGKVSAITDPVNAGVANTFTYATNQTTVGLLKTYSPLTRNTTVYTLDELGRVTQALDPEGYITHTTLDANSNLTQLVLPIEIGGASQTIAYTYDASGNVLSETTQLSATQNVVTAMTYNTTNDLLTRSEADNDAAVKLVSRQTYDTAGHLTSVNVNCTTSGTTPPTPASSCTGAGTQDSATNLISTFTYTANDQVETETDPEAWVTKHVYDTYGNETSTIQNFVLGQNATAERNVTASFAYDQSTSAGKAGLVTNQSGPAVIYTNYSYDALGRQTTTSFLSEPSIPNLTQSTTYDQLGNVLTENDAWTGASRTTQHVYDKANREESTIDPVGVESVTTYNAAGNAVATTAGGVTTTRTFDGLGGVITEGVGTALTTHAYEGQGRETETVNAEGVVTTRAYDLAGRPLAEIVDPDGAALQTTFTYDRLGRLLSTTAPDGSTSTTTYDRPGRTVSTSEAGASSTLSYDRAGNQTSAVAPDGTVTKTIYDPLNRPTVVVANDVATPTEPTQDVTTTTYYDAAGRTLAILDANGITTRYLYNVRGLARKSIANCTSSGTTPPPDPASCTGNGTHDATTNIVTTTQFDGSGAATLVVVAEGTADVATIETAYDAAGRQIAVKDPLGTVSQTLYDTSGRQTSTIVNCTNDSSNPSPPTTNWWTCSGSTLHDGTWNVTSSRTYDSRGNVATETAPNGRVTRYLYDDADGLIQRTENFVTGTPTSADQNISTFFAYDDAGRQTAVRMPTADRDTFAVTRFVFDDAGRLAQEIGNCTDSGTVPPGDPAWKSCAGNGTRDASTNLVTLYGYDERGHRTSVTGADPSATTGTSSATVTTRYAFDTDNRLCRVLENATVDLASLAEPCSTPVTGTTTANVSTRYAYDGLGNLASMIDARGNTTLYDYDEAGRMISLTDPVGKTTTWTYDDLGRRVSQSERGTTTTLVSWTFDAAGRMLSRATDDGTTTYEYDVSGNREKAISPGSTISTTFDRLNRPVEVTVDDDPAATTSYTYSLTSPAWTDPSGSYSATLDAFDRQLTLTDPIHGSSTFSWSYRADGQPASMSAPNDNVTAFSYDAPGNLASKVTTGTGGATRAAYGFSRNRAGQILSEASTITGDPTNGTTTYTYDKLARLAGFTRSSVTTNYGWQEAPNRSSVQAGTGPSVTTTFDTANRPTADSAGGSYSHDDEGRLTARPGQILEWDDLGRLIAVRDSSTNDFIAEYAYDALDRLLTVTHGSDVVRFRYVGMTTQVAQTLDVSSTEWTVIRSIANDWTAQRLVDWTGSGSNQRFYGTNAHHDVTWTASDSGAVSATLRYDPWGNLSGSTGTSLPDFRFQGSWLDGVADLQWVVARWYAPALGRFITEDTLLGDISDPPSRHFYAYGSGDPLRGWDPAGTHRLSLRYKESANSIAEHYYGSNSFTTALLRANNRYYYQSQLGPMDNITLPERLCAGARCATHTVYARDDPIRMHNGLVFGSPYVGSPLTDGWKAWQPRVISPSTSTCSSSTGCLNPGSGSSVNLPTGSGSWIVRHGWQSTMSANGWVTVGGRGERVSVPILRANWVFSATTSVASHGTLVTMWANYDLSSLACNNPWLRSCPVFMSSQYSVSSGHHALNGVGEMQIRTRPFYEYAQGGVGATTFSAPLSSPPMTYGHANIWVPRAWGPVNRVGVNGAVALQDGWLVYSSSIDTHTSRPSLTQRFYGPYV